MTLRGRLKVDREYTLEQIEELGLEFDAMWSDSHVYKYNEKESYMFLPINPEKTKFIFERLLNTSS
ncbi:MAG: hypothetical protein CMH64_00380 [Nanoarchaeota archaeon]|nr:hypothetical protein [Nanoarchaeota archaeon]|tara:strand:- start:116 stop:313 length:198 start_codon:yes stop_codon:yes gene_type:complete